jgi:hypothetical protein
VPHPDQILLKWIDQAPIDLAIDEKTYRKHAQRSGARQRAPPPEGGVSDHPDAAEEMDADVECGLELRGSEG